MRNEKGVTVIELMAAVSILLIISSVLYSVLISANKNYNSISEKSNLEQEANLILATIKSYHQKYPSYYLSCSGSKVYIGTSTASNPLGRSDLDIVLKIDNDDDFSKNTPAFPDGTTAIESSRPIYVYLQLTNKQEQSYTMITTIKKY